MKVALSLMCVGFFCSLAIADEAITPADPQLGRPVDFYRDVYPILESKCLACHSAAVKEGDLILESAESLIKGGASGEAVVAGQPDESYLYRVAARVDEPVMPPLPNKVQASALTPLELGTLKQWIVEGAQAGQRQVETSIAWQPVPDTFKAVYSLAMDPNRRFVYAGRGNRIFAYDLVSGQELSRFTDPTLLSLRQDDQPFYGPGVAHRDFVHSLAVSPDGQLIASGGFRVVKLWQRQAPVQAASIQLPAKPTSMAIDPSATIAAFLLEDQRIQLWNMTNGQPGVLLPASDHQVTALAIGPDGKTIVTATESGEISVSQVADGSTTPGLTTPGPITALATTSAEEKLLTAHADNIIRIWNWADVQKPVAEGAEPPAPVAELKGHSQAVTVLSVVADRQELLSGSRDGTVRVWNLQDGKQLFSQNLGAPVTALSMSADGNHIAAAGENQQTIVWNRGNQKLATVQGDQSLAALVQRRTDDQTVAKAQLAQADKALQDAEKDLTQREESLKQANEQKDKVTKELEEAKTKLDEAKSKAEDAAKKLEEKPEDGGLKKAKEEADKALTAAEEAHLKAMDAVGSANRAIELSQQSIDTAKQNVEQRKANKTAAEAQQAAADAALAQSNEAVKSSNSVVAGTGFSAEGTLLTTVGSGQPVQWWHATSGQPVGTVALPGGEFSMQAVLQNGFVVTVDPQHAASVWDISPRWTLKTVLGVDPANPLDVSQSKFEDRVTALAFSPDGQLLATGGGEASRNGELMLWNVADGQLVRTIEEAHSDSISDLEFSRDGKLLVTGAADKFVKVFHVEDGSLYRAYEGHTDHVLGVAFKADQSSLASAGADKAIKIWNFETGEQQRTISNYSKQVTSVDYVGVSDNLISGSGDRNVKYHRAANGQNFRTFGGNGDFVYASLSTGDEALVVAAGEDGVVRVWDGRNGKLLHSFTPPESSPAETAQR